MLLRKELLVRNSLNCTPCPKHCTRLKPGLPWRLPFGLLRYSPTPLPVPGLNDYILRNISQRFSGYFSINLDSLLTIGMNARYPTSYLITKLFAAAKVCPTECYPSMGGLYLSSIRYRSLTLHRTTTL